MEGSIRRSIGLLVGRSATVDSEKQVQLQWKPNVDTDDEKKTQ